MRTRKIKLFGEDYVLWHSDGPDSEEWGSISKKENMYPSYAYLYENGDICRDGETIGTKADIEFV